MNKLLLNGILMALFAIIIASCQYKFIVEPIPPPPPPGDTTSFSLDIVPIFAEQNCTGCHPSSANLDLTADKAYNSITSLELVVAEDPSASKIYYYPLPDGNHFAKYTTAQSILIQYWIDEGAKNN
ncbi:MAG: hypothetical protein HQ521_07050 [Bacteroidetes bacterium]|nr:hypothetical protein [Bacteroidota bacterium]